MITQNRRSALKSIGAAGLATVLSPLAGCHASSQSQMASGNKLKGQINHSVCKWPFSFLTLDELCLFAKSLGITAIDLLTPAEFPTVQKHGMVCSMCYTAGKTSLTEGWNRTENHASLIKDYLEAIPVIAAAGFKNLICFSGNRNGMDDETGLKNCVTGFKKILGLAEKHGITIQMEVFNSKVDHKDYMADNTPWTIELCRQLDSPNFKILYDIYHMQINEGNVIANIRANHQWFGHYHTAGVPGRHELDENQELQYSAIMKAIVATGFNGYVAQEFMPTGTDNAAKLEGLVKAVHLCDV